VARVKPAVDELPHGRRVDSLSPGARRCRKKFLRAFPAGFRDETYRDWERDYKWEAHERWVEALGRREFEGLVREHAFGEIAARAVRVEQRVRHSMLFSFEKMALRDAVKSEAGARTFAEGLYRLLHGSDPIDRRFEQWIAAVGSLPRRQTRVLTWPMVTVWGFLAQPSVHFFMKPLVTRLAAEKYGFPLRYRSRPSWDTYESVLEFAGVVKRDVVDLRPRDMIDIQSFLWVQGSDEYA
jgi:hypothetical protein